MQSTNKIQTDYKKKLLECQTKHNKFPSEENLKELKKSQKEYDLYVEIQKIINSNQNDYYKILGVDKSSSIKEIKKAFRALASKFHPSRAHVQGSVEAMTIIQKAYSELETEEKKEAYDHKIKYKNIFDSNIQNNFSQNPFFYSTDNGFQFTGSSFGQNPFNFGNNPFIQNNYGNNPFEFYSNENSDIIFRQIYSSLYINARTPNYNYQSANEESTMDLLKLSAIVFTIAIFFMLISK